MKRLQDKVDEIQQTIESNNNVSNVNTDDVIKRNT